MTRAKSLGLVVCGTVVVGAMAWARAAVTQESVNLDRTVIRSPIHGIVIDRDVDVGQTLAAAMQPPVLFRIATNLAHVQMQVASTNRMSPG